MSSQPHPSLLCWHQPVAPFVIQQGRHPRIGLWLQAELWPEQVLLRCEPDNEERLVTMVLSAGKASLPRFSIRLSTIIRDPASRRKSHGTSAA